MSIYETQYSDGLKNFKQQSLLQHYPGNILANNGMVVSQHFLFSLGIAR